MKAAEIKNHPAFPTTTWRLQPTQEGKLQVAKDRGGPLGLSWEIHGEGKERLVVSSGPAYLFPMLPSLRGKLIFLLCGE